MGVAGLTGAAAPPDGAGGALLPSKVGGGPAAGTAAGAAGAAAGTADGVGEAVGCCVAAAGPLEDTFPASSAAGGALTGCATAAGVLSPAAEGAAEAGGSFVETAAAGGAFPAPSPEGRGRRAFAAAAGGGPVALCAAAGGGASFVLSGPPAAFPTGPAAGVFAGTFPEVALTSGATCDFGGIKGQSSTNVKIKHTRKGTHKSSLC